MTSTATILLLALGAAAEVPHWVQKKQQPPFKMSVLSVFSMQSRLLQQTQNSRRLDAHESETGIMSKGCQEACPGVMDFIKAMMEAGATRRRLDGHEEGGMSPEMMTMMCEHVDTLKCTGETEACKDPNATEEDKDGAANLACMCKCPKLVEAMTAGEEKAMEMMCKDKAGTVGCVTSTAECSAMKGEIDEKEYDLMCAFQAKGCEEKSNNMATCAGAEDMGTWTTTKCDTADGIKANADTCCPIGKKLVDCMTVDCITLAEAMEKLDDNHSDDGSMAASREACPDAGLPSAAAIDAAASSGTLDAPAASGESADFAAPGQSVSMLAMGLVMVASLIA